MMAANNGVALGIFSLHARSMDNCYHFGPVSRS